MMRHKKDQWPILLILLAAGLTSCNLGKAPEPTADVNAVYTSVAATMIGEMNDQLTQTAQAVSPAELASPTSLPTLPPVPIISLEATNTSLAPNASNLITPLAVLTPLGGTPAAGGTGGSSSSTAVGCADSVFILDVTYPDGTKVKAGTVFTKTWRMKNTGTCSWDDGFKFAYAYGSKMGGGDVAITQKHDFIPPGGSADYGVKLTAPSIPNTYSGCWKMQTDSGYFFGGVACVVINVIP